MSPRSIPVSPVALAATALLASLALAAVPAAAQDGDLCDALTPEEVSAAAPGTYEALGSFPGTCSWHGTSVAGETVDVILYVFAGSTSDLSDDPRVVETTVAGYPAVTMTDTTTDPPGGAVGVEVGDDLVMVTVSTSDPAVDLVTAASTLASIAVGRVPAGTPSEPQAGGSPVESTHGEPCSLFSTDALSELLGTAVSAFPDVESCRWDSADGGSSVSISFADGGLTTFKTVFPAGEDTTVAGQPAYQVDQGFPGLAGWQVSVDLGPDTMSVLVTSTDQTLDVASIARDLAETAFDAGVQVLPEPEGVVAACQLATPEAIATAAGIDATLKVLDLETVCTYDGGKGDRHLTIVVAMQDPATFEMAIEALGGASIDGPGERSWWLADYGTLATRQGDLALQVTVTPDKQTSEGKLQKLATAIMEVLLPPGT
jgi:hypothetical protein